MTDDDYKDKIIHFMGRTEEAVKNLDEKVEGGFRDVKGHVKELGNVVYEVKSIQDKCPYKDDDTGVYKLLTEVKGLTEEVRKRKSSSGVPSLNALMDIQDQSSEKVGKAITEALNPIITEVTKPKPKRWYDWLPLIATILAIVGILCTGAVWLIKGPGSVDPALAKDLQDVVKQYKKLNGNHKKKQKPVRAAAKEEKPFF